MIFYLFECLSAKSNKWKIMMKKIKEYTMRDYEICGWKLV